MMRGSPGPPGALRSSLPNFANIHQCEIHMKPRKRQNFLQVKRILMVFNLISFSSGLAQQVSIKSQKD